MTLVPKEQLVQMETTCGSLLYELRVIWDEVGETDSDRDKMLLELEQECMEVYRRKVDNANRSRAQLRQAIADCEAELASICSAIGEPPVHIRQSNHKPGGLKEELRSIVPQLEEMRKRKAERWNQFLAVIEQIKKISSEIRPANSVSLKAYADQTDLSLRRFEELNKELESLQQEKSERLKKVMEHLNSLHLLCQVLGVDFRETVSEVHPSLDDSEQSKCISDATIERLASTVDRLREIKIARMQKFQDLARSMLELWNLMDTPIEEQQIFQNVTCNIAASEHELTEPNALSLDYLSYVEAEVTRLEQLKASKMKDLVLKKKLELEEHKRRAHLVADEDSITQFAVEAIEAGTVDPGLLLEQIENQISSVKEEAFSRKDILEKVDKWMSACEEESWLEEYNKDENRYNAGRGAHLTLKRAEKARALINKIPTLVESLASKVAAWEQERGMQFTYDGVGLLAMLEDYTFMRQEKEQEKKRQRDQKKLQDQRIAEQEALYGSKPSPSKPQSAKKTLSRPSTGTGSSRRQSLGGALIQAPRTELQSSKSTRSAKKMDDFGTLSPARRGLDIAGLPAKKLGFNAVAIVPRETEPRRPFTQLVLANTPLTTPAQPASHDAEEENRTPPKAVESLLPKTPMTVSAPMQMAMTPAPASTIARAKLAYEDTAGAKQMVPETDREESFEERRLAQYLTCSS